MRFFIGILGTAIILGAVVLYLMSFGVLVSEEVRKAADIGARGDVLVCHYFVGTQVIPVEFWTSLRRVCPSLYSF